MSKDEAYIKKHELTEQDLEKLERATISHHCRMEVLRFASFMEDILQKNDYKGGWEDCDMGYLEARLVEEMGEYFALTAKNKSYQITDMNEYLVKKRKELIDIANFCMMLWARG